MDPELKKELEKLRAEAGALVSLLPFPVAAVVRPIVARILRVLELLAEKR